MLQRTPRSLHVAIVLLLLLMCTVFPTSAQSNPSTRVVQSADGSFSIRLPQSWVTQNTTFPGLSTVIVIGDSSASRQSELDHMGSGQPNLTPGMSGFIARLDLSGFPGSSLDDIETSVLQAIGQLITDQGAQILNEQTVTSGGGYPTDVTIVQDGTGGLRGYYGIMQANDMLIQFQLTGRPVSTFTANDQLLGAIIDAIRAPAEPVSNLQPTAVIATPIPVNPNPQPRGEDGTTASDSGTFSFQTPPGWSHQTANLPGFSDVLVFGSSDAAAQGIVDLFVNGQEPDSFDGVAGFFGAIAPEQLQGQAPDALVSPLMQSILTNIGNDSVQIIEQPAAHNFGQYPGELALTSLGYIAVLHSDQTLLVAVVLSNDVNANGAVMTSILDSVRMPAESGNEPPPTAMPPQPQPTEDVIPVQPTPTLTPQTVRSSDDQVSLVLPGPGTVLDHMADQNILAYGATDAAAQSRLYSVNADLAPSTPLSGTGGVIILYPMDRFGIDPQNPDLTGLMDRALGGLKGYTVEQAAQPIGDGGLYAEIASSGERGYLALLPFGDQIAYVTATTNPLDFTGNESLLLDIVQSVHVPAVSEESGLGGLGGLDEEPAATPEATPEATEAPSGLSGL